MRGGGGDGGGDGGGEGGEGGGGEGGGGEGGGVGGGALNDQHTWRYVREVVLTPSGAALNTASPTMLLTQPFGRLVEAYDSSG